MEMHDVISKLEFMRNAYQKLIDENVDCGTIVGTDITGTWKAEAPLNDVYKQHVEALDTAIKVLSAQSEIIRCKDCRYHDDVDEHEYWCNGWGWPARLITPYFDFCSRGKRREDG